MRSLLLFSIFIGFVFSFVQTVHAEPVLSSNGNYTIDYDLRIQVGTDNQGNPVEVEAFLRKPVTKGVLFPTVVFITSWASPLFEYDFITSKLADKGYAVITYTPRGFLNSDGVLGTASPQDTADAIAVIDWMIENNISNPDAIGIAGISYGAGIGYNVVANRPNIRALVALSGWGNLVQSLAPNLTPRVDWITALNVSSYLTSDDRNLIGGGLLGLFPDDIQRNINDLNKQTNLPTVFEWASLRSAETYWDNLSTYEYQPAIYAVNNYQDYLFQPDSAIALLKRHTGPWRLDLNFGSHGVPEGLAQLNPFDYTWNNALNWFDHYLKGEQNYVQCLKPVNAMIHDRVDNLGVRESQDELEDENEATQTTYFFQPQATNNAGLLDTTPFAGSSTLSFSTTEYVITTGGFADQMLGHRSWNIGEIGDEHSLVFTSPELTETLNLRGSAKVSFFADIQTASQFFVYLLAMDPETKQTQWLSHAPYSFYSIIEGEDIVAGVTKVEFDLFWTAADVPAGKQIVVVIDGQDPDYLRGNETPETNTVIIDNSRPASITLPSVVAPKKLFTLQDMTNEQKQNCEDDNPSDLSLGQVRSNVTSNNTSSSGNTSSANNTSATNVETTSEVKTFSNGGGLINFYFLLLISLAFGLKKSYKRFNSIRK